MIPVLKDDELGTSAGEAPGFGALRTERGCLPLIALDLDVRIEGLVASGCVTQTFRNVFADPLEATYIFPLPPRAAVIGFRMIVDGAVIEGRIDERAKAREDYEAAIARGQSAAIAEEERPDVFTIRVGNIRAGALARIEFSLVAPLSIDALEATYRFPLVVAPRYCPGTTLDGEPVGDGVLADTDLVPDASRISPPVLLPGVPNPVRLGIRVALAGVPTRPQDLGASLPVRVGADPTTLQVVVEPGQRLDRDFVLRFPLPVGPVAQARVFVEGDATRAVGMGRTEPGGEAPGDGTFSCVVLPPAVDAGARPPRDVVFVLDRSGSMEGWKIAAARRAVARSIDTLSGDDRLAVLAFDSTTEHLGDTCELRPATDRTRWAILEWLGKLEARGGTEMERALAEGLAVFGAARHEGTDREGRQPKRDPILVLVTDGEIGNEEHILARLETSLGRTTLHIVGIGTAVNDGLLSRLVDASGGSAESVESEDRLDAVMDRIQERLVAPLVTDVTIEGTGIEILGGTVVPARRPSLYPGVPLVLRGRCRGTAGRVTVRGTKRDGADWRLDTAVQESAAPGVGTLWARGMLRHLEDVYAIAGELDDGALERRIVALSTGFGILSRFTAVVAIDPRMPEGPVDGTSPRRVVQPVMMPMDRVDLLRSVTMGGASRPVNWRRSFARPVDFLVSRDDTMGGSSMGGSSMGGSSMGGSFRGSSSAGARWPWLLPQRHASDGSADACPAEKAMIREAIALLRPRSGRLDDVTPEMVAMLVGEVTKVLAALRANGVTSPHLVGIERLLSATETAAAKQRSDLLGILLKCLADFADPIDRWWDVKGSAVEVQS